MLKLSDSFLSAFFCMIFVSSGFSLLLIEKEISVLPKNEGVKADELQRRKEIAEGYLSTLDTIKEQWIDPNQMLNCESRECVDIVKKSENIYTIDARGEETSSDTTRDEIDSIHNKINIDHQTLQNKPNDHAQSPLANVYFSRWVKKVLLLIERENIDESSLVSFLLNKEVHSYLKELSHKKTLEVSQIDELFTNLLNDVIISKQKIYDWTDVLNYSKYIVWVITAGSLAIFILYLFYTSSLNHPYLTSFFIFLALAVFWHWMHLFQQRVAFKQAELSSKNIPNECRKHDFAFLEHIQEYFKSFFKSNGCIKYHEALLVDPFWEVSVTVAVSEAFAAFILQPLSTGSHILNKSLKHLFDELSVEIKVFIIAFILLMLVMKCNYRIKLPYFMGVIEPCHPVGSSVQNVQPTKSITESSKENVMMVLQKEEKKPIKGVEYNILSPSADKPTKYVQQVSKRVQVILGPSECYTCGCYNTPCKIDSVQKSKYVPVIKITDDNKTTIPGNLQSETDHTRLNQPVDSSKNLPCMCLQFVPSKIDSVQKSESVPVIKITDDNKTAVPGNLQSETGDTTWLNQPVDSSKNLPCMCLQCVNYEAKCFKTTTKSVDDSESFIMK